jgi:hypothetical protein
MRLAAVAITFLLTSCSVSAKDHCTQRQELWEHAVGDDDPEFAESTRESYVSDCTKLLSDQGARTELACRHRCLESVNRATKRNSEEAKAAYGAIQSCEAACL